MMPDYKTLSLVHKFVFTEGKEATEDELVQFVKEAACPGCRGRGQASRIDAAGSAEYYPCPKCEGEGCAQGYDVRVFKAARSYLAALSNERERERWRAEETAARYQKYLKLRQEFAGREDTHP